MHMLLTHAYYLYEDPAERGVMRPYPPLGLMYITSHLRSIGSNVDLVDSTFMRQSAHLELIRNTAAPVVGIYVNLMTRGNALKVIAAAKAAGAVVVLGGPEPVNYVSEYLDRGADVIVSGEGEITLTELLPILQSGDWNALHTVPGIVYRDTDGIEQATPPRVQIKSLDKRPYPARDAIDMAEYMAVWKQHHGASSISLITARGCPYTCRWCSHSVYGFTYRHRSPADVADELLHIKKAYNPDHVWYADDVFSMSRHWLRKYVAELRERNIHMPFETISREDRLDEEMIGLLAELGCYRLWVGAESGSQRILDAMDRRTDVVRMREIMRLLKAHGIRSGTFIMLGYEGEQWADIDRTMQHLCDSLPDDLLTTLAYPIKGTPYYDDVADRIIKDSDWANTSDREMSVSGRHSGRFYDHARKWIGYRVGMARQRENGDASVIGLIRNYLLANRHRAAMHLYRRQVERSSA